MSSRYKWWRGIVSYFAHLRKMVGDCVEPATDSTAAFACLSDTHNLPASRGASEKLTFTVPEGQVQSFSYCP